MIALLPIGNKGTMIMEKAEEIMPNLVGYVKNRIWVELNKDPLGVFDTLTKVYAGDKEALDTIYKRIANNSEAEIRNVDVIEPIVKHLYCKLLRDVVSKFQRDTLRAVLVELANA